MPDSYPKRLWLAVPRPSARFWLAVPQSRRVLVHDVSESALWRVIVWLARLTRIGYKLGLQAKDHPWVSLGLVGLGYAGKKRFSRVLAADPELAFLVSRDWGRFCASLPGRVSLVIPRLGLWALRLAGATVNLLRHPLAGWKRLGESFLDLLQILRETLASKVEVRAASVPTFARALSDNGAQATYIYLGRTELRVRARHPAFTLAPIWSASDPVWGAYTHLTALAAQGGATFVVLPSRQPSWRRAAPRLWGALKRADWWGLAAAMVGPVRAALLKLANPDRAAREAWDRLWAGIKQARWLSFLGLGQGSDQAQAGRLTADARAPIREEIDRARLHGLDPATLAATPYLVVDGSSAASLEEIVLAANGVSLTLRGASKAQGWEISKVPYHQALAMVCYSGAREALVRAGQELVGGGIGLALRLLLERLVIHTASMSNLFPERDLLAKVGAASVKVPELLPAQRQASPLEVKAEDEAVDLEAPSVQALEAMLRDQGQALADRLGQEVRNQVQRAVDQHPILGPSSKAASAVKGVGQRLADKVASILFDFSPGGHEELVPEDLVPPLNPQEQALSPRSRLLQAAMIPAPSYAFSNARSGFQVLRDRVARGQAPSPKEAFRPFADLMDRARYAPKLHPYRHDKSSLSDEPLDERGREAVRAQAKAFAESLSARAACRTRVVAARASVLSRALARVLSLPSLDAGLEVEVMEGAMPVGAAAKIRSELLEGLEGPAESNLLVGQRHLSYLALRAYHVGELISGQEMAALAGREAARWQRAFTRLLAVVEADWADLAVAVRENSFGYRVDDLAGLEAIRSSVRSNLEALIALRQPLIPLPSEAAGEGLAAALLLDPGEALLASARLAVEESWLYSNSIILPDEAGLDRVARQLRDERAREEERRRLSEARALEAQAALLEQEPRPAADGGQVPQGWFRQILSSIQGGLTGQSAAGRRAHNERLDPHEENEKDDEDNAPSFTASITPASIPQPEPQAQASDQPQAPSHSPLLDPRELAQTHLSLQPRDSVQTHAHDHQHEASIQPREEIEDMRARQQEEIAELERFEAVAFSLSTASRVAYLMDRGQLLSVAQEQAQSNDFVYGSHASGYLEWLRGIHEAHPEIVEVLVVLDRYIQEIDQEDEQEFKKLQRLTRYVMEALRVANEDTRTLHLEHIARLMRHGEAWLNEEARVGLRAILNRRGLEGLGLIGHVGAMEDSLAGAGVRESVRLAWLQRAEAGRLNELQAKGGLLDENQQLAAMAARNLSASRDFLTEIFEAGMLDAYARWLRARARRGHLGLLQRLEASASLAVREGRATSQQREALLGHLCLELAEDRLGELLYEDRMLSWLKDKALEVLAPSVASVRGLANADDQVDEKADDQVQQPLQNPQLNAPIDWAAAHQAQQQPSQALLNPIVVQDKHYLRQQQAPLEQDDQVLSSNLGKSKLEQNNLPSKEELELFSDELDSNPLGRAERAVRELTNKIELKRSELGLLGTSKWYKLAKEVRAGLGTFGQLTVLEREERLERLSFIEEQLDGYRNAVLETLRRLLSYNQPTFEIEIRGFHRDYSQWRRKREEDGTLSEERERFADENGQLEVRRKRQLIREINQLEEELRQAKFQLAKAQVSEYGPQEPSAEQGPSARYALRHGRVTSLTSSRDLPVTQLPRGRLTGLDSGLYQGAILDEPALHQALDLTVSQDLGALGL